ncbi:ABC-F family ATP-binding cassette domain-containing protein [Rufibacter glacialis]|uniref:Probable ATP-binding protein YbiT n=1 Tax=Rufibacter glacialis TaxID=1259555 RepID=A0A5M8QIR0_9BACT|nr:ABC-F family ATP-binding cassette domain-containing protein [Rufibacter glacialis]KAA6434653.1 ABC-F family ATP-binding cassette domain-containing protein [Rufibacter glacialis]GGK71376.1 ABC transporter ATP-binding protein [Rufibacter glacialis]
MISINNLQFHFGSRTLYEDANLHIKPKDKIGLVGLNGTGKSTLLRLLVGEYKPDGGSIQMSRETTLGFLNQDLLSYDTHESILNVAMQAFEEAIQLQHQIDEVLHQMETDYQDEHIDKLARLQEHFEALDGYNMQIKAEEILEGLGFTTQELQQPLKTFSGGWRMRVMLAKILLQKPSLLLLDEPTNHLDLPSIKWIENYLSAYEGALVIVSHDREFLDRTTNVTVEVSGGKLNVYAGNYSFYLEEKELRNEIQKGAYENQQQQIKQAEQFIARFKAKATKAKQAQSRMKALDKMERIEDVAGDAPVVNFKFQFTVQPGRNILRLENVSKSYGEKLIFQNTHVNIERGDKIALIGANGKGKSTLMRIIAGDEPIKGERQLGHNVIMAFYAQHQLESLHVENEILQEMVQAGSRRTEMELRGVLGSFLFTGDTVFKKIKVLSGGEKSRVALAKTLISEANFLLLDEPTNHLDMQSVNILIQALEQYEGTFVVISHDRYFVENVANKIWYIEDHVLKEYPGTYHEYEYWMEQRDKGLKRPTPQQTASNAKAPAKPKPTPSQQQELEQELKKVNQKLKQVEGLVNELEGKLKNCESKLALPSTYADPNALHEATQQFNKIKGQLDKEQGAWEQLMLQADELENQLK